MLSLLLFSSLHVLFFNYSLFYFNHFISFYFFHPRILEVGKCVPCVQVATPLLLKSDCVRLQKVPAKRL